MKPKILVDTSIWINFFSQSSSRYGNALEELIVADQIVYTGVVLAELLQGAKIEKEFKKIHDNFTVFPYLETTRQTWLSTGELSFSLRRKGITLPISDIVIACLARENNCHIFSLDQHFEKIPKLKMHQI